MRVRRGTVTVRITVRVRRVQRYSEDYSGYSVTVRVRRVQCYSEDESEGQTGHSVTVRVRRGTVLQ